MSAIPLRLPRQRAVLYLRQSVYREESISLELQEQAGRDYCERQGYAVIAVEADPGISGRTWKRPAVQRVMELVEQQQVDVIVLWKWSRLSRSRLDWAVAVDKVESLGGRIESATEPLDTTTASGRFARGVMTEYAAFQSEQIGETWKETIRSRIGKGLPGSGGPRFGYTHPEKDVYEPDTVTGVILAECYRLRAEDGVGYLGLAKWLNRQGVLTTGGSPWDATKIRLVMESGFAAGLIITGVQAKQHAYHAGRHEALITPETWDRYLATARPGANPAWRSDPASPLTGLIKCGDCGSSMRRHLHQSGGKYVPGFVCNRAVSASSPIVSCTEHRALAAVKEWVFDLTTDLDAMAAAEQKITDRRVAQINDAAAIDRRIEKIKGDLANLTIRYVQERVGEDAYQATAARFQTDIERLRSSRREAEPSPQVEIDIRALAITAAAEWDNATTDELRRLLTKMIRVVKVLPRRMTGERYVKFDVIPLWA